MNMSRNSLCALFFHAENELEDRISDGNILLKCAPVYLSPHLVIDSL